MILSINPGSSSLKYKLFDSSLSLISEDNISIEDGSVDFNLAIEKMLKYIEANFTEIEKVAVRVVHGGPNNNDLAQINDQILSEIEKYSVLAPLHNPPALNVIKNLIEKFGQDKIYAVFDTGYFNSLPEEASRYALGNIETPIIIKRYGFHGISHKAMQTYADLENLKKVITIHLGAGCSMSAIKEGKVIATSMGLTPDEGLVMQTRCGDIDPGLVLYLTSEIGLEKTKELIEKKSGLAGLTGTSGNMIDVLLLAGEEVTGADLDLKYEKSEETVKKAKLALNIYINKIKQYIGSYTALMGGLDTIVFSGKIGSNSKVIRDKAVSGLDYLGEFEIKVIEADEELAMARLVNK
jgi:acetate kinase